MQPPLCAFKNASTCGSSLNATLKRNQGLGCRSGAKRQGILVGMGVHAGFADLMVMGDGRVLFLELKAPKGRLRPDQEAFRDAVLAQGFGWALVRSLDDALGALADHGFTTRVRPARRTAP